jgi:hypothetical protein
MSTNVPTGRYVSTSRQVRDWRPRYLLNNAALVALAALFIL